MTPSGNQLVHGICPRLRGPNAGSVDITVLTKDGEAVDLARKIAANPCSWWWHVWTLKGYTLGTKQSLMESFDLEAAMLAPQTKFDNETLEVSGHFGNEDKFLDEAEEWLDSDDEDAGNDQGPLIDVADASMADLESALRDKDDNLEDINSRGSAASRRTNFSQSTGNATNRSVNTAKLAMTHKDRALDLAKAHNENATLQKQNADLLVRMKQIEQMMARSSGLPSEAPPQQSSDDRMSGEDV